MSDNSLPSSPTKDFERIKKVNTDIIEFWMARELMLLLGYSTWQNFEVVIKKAMQVCLKSGQYVENHFSDATKMVL